MAIPNKMLPMRAMRTDTIITIPNIPACLGFINNWVAGYYAKIGYRVIWTISNVGNITFDDKAIIKAIKLKRGASLAMKKYLC